MKRRGIIKKTEYRAEDPAVAERRTLVDIEEGDLKLTRSNMKFQQKTGSNGI